MPKNILVYNGPGVGPLSVQNTITTLQQLIAKNYNIITVDSEIIVNQNWQANAALFIMPGGADLPYLASLQGYGNAKIKDYVNNGGKYLGICAGAYYAADRLEFAKGDPELEVIGERELKFFPGLITGPAYSWPAEAQVEKFSWQLSQPFAINAELHVFYHGGGSFIAPENYSNVLVLARYYRQLADEIYQPAAIVECIIGRGRAILSSPHFETPFDKLDLKLQIYEERRRLLAKYLLERMNIACIRL